jgi:hypothetical protein
VDVETERPEALARELHASLNYCGGEHAIEHAKSLRVEDTSPEGLAEEIARLRKVIRDRVSDENVPLMLSGMDGLRKLLLAQFRMSKKAQRDLNESIEKVLRHYTTHRYGDERE